MPTRKSHRPWWVLVIAGLYLLVLLTPLVLWAHFWVADGSTPLRTQLVLGLMLPFGCLLLGAGLIAAPVQLATRRPLHRAPVWITILAAGALASLLVLGAIWSGLEYLRVLTFDHGPGWLFYLTLGTTAMLWLVWIVLFHVATQYRDPGPWALRLHHWLLAGSALELIIAVSAHVVVRRRTECCAGFLTGTGIALGAGVMILAFGPAIVLLFARRWQKIDTSKLPGRGFEVLPASPVTLLPLVPPDTKTPPNP